MAIINTFEKCLESPYLSTDELAPGRVPALLRLAADRLEAASGIHRSGHGDPADVVLFSYEAIFATLRALVYQHGYRESGLRCLLLAFDRLYIAPGLVDASFLDDFERAQTLKLTPEEALESASAWVRRTLELVGAALTS